MPAVNGCENNGFEGRIRLKRFSPPVIRNVLFWEYEEPYRIGRARIMHIPGFTRGRIRGTWDDRTAKDFDDHEQIQKHLLDGLQGRARGYFAGKDGRINEIPGDELTR